MESNVCAAVKEERVKIIVEKGQLLHSMFKNDEGILTTTTCTKANIDCIYSIGERFGSDTKTIYVT